MSKATKNLLPAQQRAMAGPPKVGGFPYLAETLRLAGVTRNTIVPARTTKSLSNGVWAGGEPGRAAVLRHRRDVPPFFAQMGRW